MARSKSTRKNRHRRFDTVEIVTDENIPDKIYNDGTTFFKNTVYRHTDHSSTLEPDDESYYGGYVNKRTNRKRKRVKRKVIQIERRFRDRRSTWDEINNVLASLTKVGRLEKRARARTTCENNKAARRAAAFRSMANGTYRGNNIRKHRC